MFKNHPLSPHVGRAVWVCSGSLLAVGLLAGAVRVLPWLLDPNVPLRVALPFLRGVVELALEASLLIGWPLGWALASHRFAERGEARAMMLLGESPFQAALAQWRTMLPVVALLGVASAMGASDAGAPGRMAQALLAQGRAACGHATIEATYAVPFVSVTWLCAPGSEPRLYGPGPGALHAVAFSAKDAHIADDMRRIEFDDARFSLPASKFPVDVRASVVVLHGMPPWAHASDVSPVLRVMVVELAAMLAALVAIVTGWTRLVRGTFATVCVGVSGPLAALGLMRAMERVSVPSLSYLMTPIVALLATMGAATLFVLGRRSIARLR
jgi:hypothetical protein